jgi:O-antigen/teichoic acid export membrane protein
MWKSRIRVLQLFSAAVVDQVLLSGANFLVGFLLIRNTGDSDYATFVLVQSAILLVITAQSAWLSGPLAIIAPKRPADSRRVMVGAVEHAQRRFLRRVVLIALCVPAAGYLGGIWDAFSAAVLAIGVFAAWMALQRELVRRILLIYSRANTLLGVDAIYVVIFVGGTFAAIHVSHQAVIWAVTGLALAGWSGAAAAHRSLAKDPGWTKEGDSAPILRELRRLGVWSTVGALTYWLFSQSYNYLLVSRLDLKAVADVNAARLVIMPAIVFTVGMESLLIPKSAG